MNTATNAPVRKGLLRRGSTAAIGLVLAALGLAAAPAAQAGTASYDDCPVGRFCAWTGANGTGSRLQTDRDLTSFSATFDNRIRSYINRTTSIACLYSGRDHRVEPLTGTWTAARPDLPADGHSGTTELDKSSLKFVRTARECTLPAYPVWRSVTAPRASGFGDLNGDRRPDVLVRDDAGRLWFLPGDGTGRLVGVSGWNALDSFTRHGDFTGDGREDLIAREPGTGRLWLYPGTGAGDFLARRLIGGSGWNGMSLITAFGDLTGDGRSDLVARETATGRLWLYPGTAAGGLAPRILIGGSGWGAMNALVGAGDLTGDGRPDLLAREAATDRLWLYPGGSSALSPRRLIGTGWNAMSGFIANGDSTGDGRNDLVTTLPDGRLLLHAGRGDGTFTSAVVRDSQWFGLNGAF